MAAALLCIFAATSGCGSVSDIAQDAATNTDASREPDGGGEPPDAGEALDAAIDPDAGDDTTDVIPEGCVRATTAESRFVICDNAPGLGWHEADRIVSPSSG